MLLWILFFFSLMNCCVPNGPFITSRNSDHEYMSLFCLLAHLINFRPIFSVISLYLFEIYSKHKMKYLMFNIVQILKRLSFNTL